MTKRLVSVITPTWQRHDLLMECIENVRAQTYRPLEHIIVSDGPDPEVDGLIGHTLATFRENDRTYIPTRFVELGRNWSTFLPNNFGIGPIVAGLLLARGEYVAVWCDDERAVPHHLAAMVDLLESSGVDFAYPVVQFYRNGQSPHDGYQIGSDPPVHGQFTHYVARITAFQKAMPQWGQHPVDWTLCQSWMANGATWARLPELTFSHRADR
jgi:GT2 family glycosyltransferase